MITNWKRFAPIGLYISGLSFLATFGWLIVRREVDLYFKIGLGVIVLGLALAVLLDPERAMRFFTGRQARYGSNALVITAAFFGLLVVLNYLVYTNDKSWDLTEDQQNTLASESINTLESLPEPVIARAFFTGRQSFDYAESLLKLFAREGNDKFTYEVVNPEVALELAQQANITRDGDIVLFMGERQEKVTTISEEGITGAMVRLISRGERKVYFLTGHGERTLESGSQDSYSLLKGKLEAKNFLVESLNLLTTPAVPDDAQAIVVAGPLKPLSEEEVAAIKSYVDGGGVLVALFEPSILTQFDNAPDLLAEYLASSWGIALANDLVVDLVGAQSNNPYLAIGASFGNHAITRSLTGFVTVLPTARSVDVIESSSGATSVLLVSTTQDSWGETNLEGIMNNETPDADQNADKFGPVWLGVAAESNTNDARVVVFGDSEFADDQYIQNYGNGDLIVNALDWATGQEDLISLTPKTSTTRTLKVTPTLYTKGIILLISLFILPALPIAAAVNVMIQRRKS
jgi:ABC-type uncharacterized transport system involved in gliding motility auxiliary subunit